MLASAPFDNWWHNAYGLDVKIFSPPHVVLDGGVLAIQFGAVVLIASAMNHASGALRRKLDWILLLLWAPWSPCSPSPWSGNPPTAS